MLQRRRKRMFQARNVTYVAMALVVVGMLWWLGAPMGLADPAPAPAVLLLGLGLVMYLVGWCWLLWLRFNR